MELTIVRVIDLKKYLKRPNVYLIDIRTREEFLKYHIDGAVNVPEEKLDMFLRSKGKDAFYILCCEKGISSIREGKRLSNLGYHVGTVAGGANAYRKLKTSER